MACGIATADENNATIDHDYTKARSHDTMRGILKNAVLSLVLGLFLAAPAAAESFEEGLRAYEDGDYRSALEVFRPLADEDHPMAQHMLGIMRRDGKGVSQDHGEAVRWLREAAEQDYNWAQLDLGQMYVRGAGVPRDHAKAVHWFRKAAEQGLPTAQYNLATMYLRGEGVVQDFDKAVQWLRKAAEQGEPDAQYNLGVAYFQGKGVAQDHVQAAKWLSLAVMGETAYAEALSRVEKEMTPEQIREAQRLVLEWQPR